MPSVPAVFVRCVTGWHVVCNVFSVVDRSSPGKAGTCAVQSLVIGH